MAKLIYKGFHWNKPGYVALENSAGVQGILERKAKNIKARADASINPRNGADREHHKVSQSQGSFAKIWKVKTNSQVAKYSENKRKTLSKSMGGA